MATTTFRLRRWRGTASQRSFHDRALQWAKENPILAQQCLEVPPLDDSVAGQPFPFSPSRTCCTFDSYWNRRKWAAFDALERGDERALGRSLATHVLSAPLTLVSKLLLAHDSTVSAVSRTSKGRIHLCCVGARAEASLPLQYWREMLVVMKWSSPANVELAIDFVGPDVALRPPVELEFCGSTLLMRWRFAGKFHDYVVKDSQHYHGVVLFNPGLGHPNLKSDWAPTIDLLLRRRQQLHRNGNVLLTAHSELDADRESKYLKQVFDLDTDYRLNPFASEITYEDPFDKSHLVRPNHFAALF